MQQAQLLIVDGEPFRTPELVVVLANEGWKAAWLKGSEGLLAGVQVPPDLVLFDPAGLSPDGLDLIRQLRGRKPGLSLVALGEVAPDWAGAVGLDSRNLHRMARDTAAQAWPATLRSCLGGFGPGAQKFTTEDLFADILDDLEGGPAPAPAKPQGDLFEPFQPVPAAQPPAPAPVPVPIPVPPPVPAPVPVPPPAKPLPDLFEAFKPGPAAQAPVPDREFTLSGITGVSDPFLVAETAIKATGPLPPIQEPWITPAVQPPPPPADDSMEEFGNYYLLEKVAVGGMAELFKARQRGVHDFEKIVAIKRILPHLSDNDEFVRMFIDEAKLAAQLTHPNICQIFDLGKAMGFYYIAMEFVDGRDLRSLLRKVREYRLPVPEPIAAAVTMKVASALDYAHRKRGINDKELRLVHRDISPQNILISYEGAVKLVDFGIAKAATKTTQTMAGALKGKLLYMSPEQALGQPLDGRSDIYSLGLVLFELLTGERCFQADSELGVLEKVRMGRVADVRQVNPDVSPEMAAIVGKALNRDVDQRYLSARFLERDLKNLLVRTHSEPTEHDVAEYVGTVLKGAREDLEALLEHRYRLPQPPAPAGPPTTPVPPAAPLPAAAAPAPGFPAPAPIRIPEPLPLPPAPTVQTAGAPLWLIPALIGLIGLVAFVAYRIFK